MGGIPETVSKLGDAPAGLGLGTPTPLGQGIPVSIRRDDPYKAWDDANVGPSLLTLPEVLEELLGG